MRRLALVALGGLFVFASSTALRSSGGSHWLVRTGVPDVGAAAVIALDDVMVVSDQRDYLVAVATDAGLAELRDLNVEAHVLDSDPLPKDDYYVVRVANPDFVGSLPAGVRVLYRDRFSAVFEADPDAAIEISALAHQRGGVPCGAVVRVFFHEIAAHPRPFHVPVRHRGTAVDPLVQGLVDQVSQPNIEATVNDVSAIFSRRFNQPGGVQAQNYLVGRYQSIASSQNGMTVSTQSFDTGHDNVIAVLPGTVSPNQFVVIGAHYDSVNWQDGTTARAPGADDDGSGDASVLEAARILASSGIRFEKSIVFAAWAAEEVGLVGSQAWVNQVVIPQNMDVVAMIQLDMDGHLEAGDARDIDFATNDTDPNLTAYMQQILATYVPTMPSVTGVLTAGTSDHRSFSQNGYPAVFPFEDLTEYAHQLHTANDTVGVAFNEPTMARDFTKMVVAAAADLAVPFVGLSLEHTPLLDTNDATSCRTVVAHAASVDTLTSVRLHWSNSDSNTASVALTPTGNPNEFSATIPANPAGTTVGYYLSAADSTGRSKTLPAGAPQSRFTYITNAVERIAFFDFDGATDEGWTHGGVLDDWERAKPDQQSNYPYDPDNAWSGLKAWGNDTNAPGENGAYANNANNFLQSPAVSTVGRVGVHLHYKRWLSVEDGVYDRARILVNGSEVWRNPIGTGRIPMIDTQWVDHEIDVSSLADNQPSVQIRFELQSDGGLTFGGWNVDDLALETHAAPPTITPDDDTPALGQIVHFALSAPGHGGEQYQIVFATQTAPGTPLNPGDCRIVPWNPSNAHQRYASRHPEVAVNFTGTLDANGATTAPELWVPNNPRAAGKTVRLTGWISQGTVTNAAFDVATLHID
ncbi:MAG: M20/M25/M40 family metallo-hydrolase [Planctomycetes bacterium]|nr:M20/M25/M40 family metallo-hydrolase [Planctomycetota bacterium]